MKAMSVQLAESRPDTVVFITPHGNVFRDCLSALAEVRLYGDFSAFGSQKEGQTYPNDLALLEEIGRRCTDKDIPLVLIGRQEASQYRLSPQIDHGIMVPMHYIGEAGCRGVNMVALSMGFLPVSDLYQVGVLIREAAQSLGRRVAIVASGDMSHRLKSEGPYDYHPDGPRFDQKMQELLVKGDIKAVLQLPEELRENAGECGYLPVVMMLGALDGHGFTPQFFGYEGPFGVGYLVVGFKPDQVDQDSILKELESEKAQAVEQQRRQESIPVRWARMVLENYVRGDQLPDLPAEMNGLRGDRAGAFVSLKTKGQLRGCIGTITAVQKDLAAEIAANAVSAGTRDYRFRPLVKEELDELEYSVDILGAPEPARKEQLDPKQYGVIVSRGDKRGLLLPDLDGVDTVEQQLQIALQKAGLSPQDPFKIERFKVTRYT